VISRCLEKVSSTRYASVDELLRDLEGRTPTVPDSQAKARIVEGVWHKACQSIGEGKLDEAQRLCRQILEKAPDHEDARALQEQLQERSHQAQQLYLAVSQGMGSMSLEELITLVSETVEVFPNHPAGHVAQMRLAVKAREYRRAMENGLASASRDDWVGALSCLESARQLNPGATEVENAVRFATQVINQIRESRESIDRAVALGDGDRAMALARSLDHYRDEVRPKAAQESNGDGRETNQEPEG
jgi:tetratricopeptide (TPR) repeat protein